MEATCEITGGPRLTPPMEPVSGEPESFTVFVEPVDSVYLSDPGERQVQHELITMRLYARAGRTRPDVYAPTVCQGSTFSSAYPRTLSAKR